jgi:threonine dehydratase
VAAAEVASAESGNHSSGIALALAPCAKRAGDDNDGHSNHALSVTASFGAGLNTAVPGNATWCLPLGSIAWAPPPATAAL